MEISTFIYFLMTSMLLTIAPGPDILYLLTKSLSEGAKSGIILACGLVSGIFFHTMLVMLGVAALIQSSPMALNLLKYFGDTDGKDFKYSYDDFKTFLIYLKASLRAGLKIAPKFMDYYGEIYRDFIEQLKQQKQLLKEEGVTIN